jgi:hypothetical protein
MNEERLRVAISSSAIAVFNQDLDLRYTWIHNPNLEINAESVIGKTDADLLPTQEAATLRALKQQVLDSGKCLRKNVQMTIQGKIGVYDLTIEPLLDSSSHIVGITCSSLEVNSPKNRERADSETKGSSTSENIGGNP